jgi:hypothetical protein
MTSYEGTADPAAKAATRNPKEGARKPLPSSDDTGYAQAIAGGTVSLPTGNDPPVKPSFLPDDVPGLPSAADREDARSRDRDAPGININLTPE